MMISSYYEVCEECSKHVCDEVASYCVWYDDTTNMQLYVAIIIIQLLHILSS